MKHLKINRIIFVLLAALVANTAGIGAWAADAAEYSDVSPSAWYYDAIGYAAEAGLMQGTGDTRFSPDMNTTRATMVTTLYRLEGEPAMGNGKSGTFIDVPEYVWYTDAAEWTAAQEIVMGYGDGTFGPDDRISREQLAAMLYRYAGYKGYDVSISEDTDLQAYTDASGISGYALPAMRWAVEKGIVTGRTADTINPKDTASRAELATILTRFAAAFGTEA